MNFGKRAAGDARDAIVVTCGECRQPIAFGRFKKHKQDHVALKVLKLSVDEVPQYRSELYERRVEILKDMADERKETRRRQNSRRTKRKSAVPRLVNSTYADQLYVNNTWKRRAAALREAVWHFEHHVQDDLTPPAPVLAPQLPLKFVGREFTPPMCSQAHMLFVRRNSWSAVQAHGQRYDVPCTIASGGSFRDDKSHLSYAVLCECISMNASVRSSNMVGSNIAAYLPTYISTRYPASDDAAESGDPVRQGSPEFLLQERQRRLEVRSAVAEAIGDVERQVRDKPAVCRGQCRAMKSGSTCVCCVIDARTHDVCVSNVGNCRAVLFKAKKLDKDGVPSVKVIYKADLADDHSIQNPAELDRVRQVRGVGLADDPLGERTREKKYAKHRKAVKTKLCTPALSQAEVDRYLKGIQEKHIKREVDPLPQADIDNWLSRIRISGKTPPSTSESDSNQEAKVAAPGDNNNNKKKKLKQHKKYKPRTMCAAERELRDKMWSDYSSPSEREPDSSSGEDHDQEHTPHLPHMGSSYTARALLYVSFYDTIKKAVLSEPGVHVYNDVHQLDGDPKFATGGGEKVMSPGDVARASVPQTNAERTSWAHATFRAHNMLLLLPHDVTALLSNSQIAEVLTQLVNQAIARSATKMRIEQRLDTPSVYAEGDGMRDELHAFDNSTVTRVFESGGQTRAQVYPPEFQVLYKSAAEDPSGPNIGHHPYKIPDEMPISRADWVFSRVAESLSSMLVETDSVMNSNVLIMYK